MRVSLLVGVFVSLVGCAPVVNQAPVAAITAAPISGPIPLTVHFDASGSRDPDGQITTYEWNFGDGNTALGVKVSHTYTQAGVYAVILTVTDNLGSSAVATVVIRAGNPPPRAVLTATPTHGFTPLTVQFDASQSVDLTLTPQRIVRHEWDFGDGTRGSGVALSHTYTRAGIYTVTLTVFDEDGASNRAQTVIRALNFSFPLALGVGLSPTALTSADFNGDRRDDLAVVNFDSETLVILLSDGAGGFRR
ncbi:MAG: PKD domain-containing protein, partial [Candidatus Bipolaricaulota bacterium]|nr:PKD domain-containing protein [Candidatus Bipolaricaulota bacterium]